MDMRCYTFPTAAAAAASGIERLHIEVTTDRIVIPFAWFYQQPLPIILNEVYDFLRREVANVENGVYLSMVGVRAHLIYMHGRWAFLIAPEDDNSAYETGYYEDMDVDYNDPENHDSADETDDGDAADADIDSDGTPDYDGNAGADSDNDDEGDDVNIDSDGNADADSDGNADDNADDDADDEGSISDGTSRECSSCEEELRMQKCEE